MAQKRLLILGAGRGQIGLIEAAKSMGIHTIVATIEGQYPGISLADEVCYVDISKPDEVLEKAKELNIDGVATCCLDTGLTAAGIVADNLGLCGVSYASAKKCTNKYLMKIAFGEKIKTAKYFRVFDRTDEENALRILSFPVVVKAVDLQGSRGVYICETKQKAHEAVNKVFAETREDYIIVEEYIEGLEIGAEAFIYRGDVFFVLPNGDVTYKANTIVPVGHFIPLKIDDKTEEQIISIIKEAASVLGLDNCAINADMMIRDGEVYLIELTGRAGANCLPELVGIRYGINYYEMIASMAIGDDPTKIWASRKNKESAVIARMLLSKKKEGILKKVEYTGEQDDNIQDITFFKKPGDQIKKFENSKDCIGQVIVKGQDMEECTTKIERVMNEIVMELQ